MENYEDVKSLLSQIKQHERKLRLKRRWLMGLSLSKSEQRRIEEIMIKRSRIIPESLLREDDVYYEMIKSSVEKGFGVCNVQRELHMVHDNKQLSDLPNDLGILLSLIDDMTNKGLCHFVEILTGGSIAFEKTNAKMKKIIKECLPKILRNQNDNHQMNIMKQLSQLLKDPHNFHRNHATLPTPPSQSCHASAIKVLNRLEELPFSTLSSMHRKLRGIKGYKPQILPSKKSGWRRDGLIDQVRKSCMKMLSELSEGDELLEPLAKAMAVADITFKLILDCPSVAEFRKFSPEIKALQNDIGKAIWLLKKWRFSELKNLQLLLDPSAELSERRLRIAIRNLLTEYLLECSDMDTVPECLVQTLYIINKSSRSCSKDNIQEDIESVLNVSAQTKQIVWDLLPEHEFDQDFADAYMEDLGENDDSDSCNEDEKPMELPQNSSFHSNYSNDHVENIDETSPTNFKSPVSVTKRDASSPVLTHNRKSNSKLESVCINDMESVDSFASSSLWESKIIANSQYRDGNQYQLGNLGNFGSPGSHSPAFVANRSGSFSKGNHGEKQEPKVDSIKHAKFVSSEFSCGEANLLHERQSRSRNQYLSIQKASDETSLVGYRLIDHILDEFAQTEGLGLGRGDVSCLRGHDPIQKNVTEEPTFCEEDVHGSIMLQAIEEQLPSFPKSAIDRVKELMGLE